MILAKHFCSHGTNLTANTGFFRNLFFHFSQISQTNDSIIEITENHKKHMSPLKLVSPTDNKEKIKTF